MLMRFIRLTVYVPILEAASPELQSPIESASTVQAILDVFRELDYVGRIGTYKTVVEISSGTETFIPTMASTPTHGMPDLPSIVRSAKLITYLPASTQNAEVDRLVGEVVSAHPWEHPVVEVNSVSLWMPS